MVHLATCLQSMLDIYGEVSPKVDVYAFGIVLYELISAKEAIVGSAEYTDAKSLVYLFEETLSVPDPKEAIQELIDPCLGGDYPIDSVLKIAYLAKSCTHQEPTMRPTMRSVVVALMALSSKDNELNRGLSQKTEIWLAWHLGDVWPSIVTHGGSCM